jgi:hypothetical protein
MTSGGVKSTKPKDYKIEKGIELSSTPRGRRGLYPFDKMEVGDSFIVENRADRQKVRVASNNYYRKYKSRFTVRQWEDKWRCWRLE